jgi:DNA-binding MarR family transcriptional regulator
MNAIFFANKRVFHGSMRMMRRPLQSFGLTSARFDMLYALLPCDDIASWYPKWQSRLRRELGVSASVVSRMLRALEQLGLVRRRVSDDRRQREVRLTRRGKKCVREAYRSLRRAAQRLVDMALCGDGFRDKDQRFANMLYLDGFLFSLREMFEGEGNVELLYYWGHPDD